VIRQILKNVKQAYIRKFRVAPLLRRLRGAEAWSRDQLEDFRLGRVQAIVAHAYNTTRFYKLAFDAAGIRPDDIRSLEDFAKLPALAREDLNNHLADLVSAAVPSKNLRYASTGGSTGLATRFARDTACRYIKKAAELRFDAWAGAGDNERKLYYWPALADFAAGKRSGTNGPSASMGNTLTLFAGKLNESVMAGHLKEVRRFQPQLVRAFPGALTVFARYLKDRGEAIRHVKGIVSVGEPLLPNQRELIESVFGCPVFNCFVSREAGNTACECEHHVGMHVAEDMVHVEIINASRAGFGEIVVTDLWNMGMPLIRYRIQDAGCWLDQPCNCGRPFRVMGLEAARLSDFMVSPADGSLISSSSLTHYLLALGPALTRIKLIQTGPEALTVRIAGTNDNSGTIALHIRDTLTRIFGAGLQITTEYCLEISTLPSGKYSFFERQFIPGSKR
jgi:phenylacetate-CoA ligase